jgi:hypothetical protein
MPNIIKKLMAKPISEISIIENVKDPMVIGAADAENELNRNNMANPPKNT